METHYYDHPLRLNEEAPARSVGRRPEPQAARGAHPVASPADRVRPAAAPPRRSKAETLRLAQRLKRGIIVAALVAFGSLGVAVGSQLSASATVASTHTSTSSSSTTTHTTTSGGYFAQQSGGSTLGNASSTSSSSSSSSAVSGTSVS